MTAVTQSPRNVDVCLSEGNGAISRDAVTIAANFALVPGTVLAMETASEQYAPLDTGESDGIEVASAVLLYGIDTTDGNTGQATVIRRLAEVADDLLVWPDGITEPQKKTALGQLASAYVIAR
jgi:hypothetical protein